VRASKDGTAHMYVFDPSDPSTGKHITVSTGRALRTVVHFCNLPFVSLPMRVCPHKSADSLIPFAASHISLHNLSVSSPHAPLFAATENQFSESVLRISSQFSGLGVHPSQPSQSHPRSPAGICSAAMRSYV
jgi:hypothetical protein